MFHKEGRKIVLSTFALAFLIFPIVIFFLKGGLILQSVIYLITIFMMVMVCIFFRNPERMTKVSSNHIVSPVDGKVVIIKEVHESEYFKDKRIQISIFMSPLNVHVTRYPLSGIVKYSRYHPGKYLLAWHPKSSEKNERTSVVIENEVFGDILYRQIAGFIARRIVNYAIEDTTVLQGEDSGFIKFGSRLDLFLPLDAKIQVVLNQKVNGAEDVITTYDA